ncbi:MAG: 16S rRNA (cytosine(1402)-N(4))-methyltransferase RsmH [Kiritimatiellae bacterium]|nr:16S rRNA (cytosine(1402)-N(4))-methyltransferase RsmH [Kiritimatiellia bacterium]
MERQRHRPVLVKEVTDLLVRREGGSFIDATVGSGGHARAILERAGARARLLGIDRDPEAIDRCRQFLSDFRDRCEFVQANFADIREIAMHKGMTDVDGIIFDLGVSSEQLESAERGFSFAKDGPLDMRMDPSEGETAGMLLGRVSEEELFRMLRELGNEPKARQIARAVVRARAGEGLKSTRDLARLVERTTGGRAAHHIHPATRTFLAIRIAVNAELESLKKGLEASLSLLRKGGRLAVISFHSGEDRIVKQFFLRHVGRMESLPAGGSRLVVETPQLRLVNRRPIVPTEEEVAMNPRARSAKLRIAEVV